MTAKQMECTIPILPVADIGRSIAYYTRVLGFQLDWGGATERVCQVSRDGKPIMLMARDAPVSSTWVWIGLEDDSLFHEFREHGVKVLQEPRNFSWAYEMKFEDLDGNVLWLGTEPRRDIPLQDGS